MRNWRKSWKKTKDVLKKETKSWKVSRGIADGGDICRLCGSFRETV